MRHAVSFGALFVLCFCASAFGKDRSFPFEAAVVGHEAQVYSGPRTDDYYPTLKLQHGDRVTVVREDFGGWYLIQPLEESHSWIPVKDVAKKPGGLGVVIRQTSDRIGSNVYSGEPDVMHRLFRGEVVRIKGQSTIRLNGSPVEMYRIEPPRGEYRYISRRDVVPADEFEKQPDLLSSARADRPAAAVTLGAPDFTVSEAGTNAIQPVAEEQPSSIGPVALPQLDPTVSLEPVVTDRAEPDPARLPSMAAEGVPTPAVGFGSVTPLADAGMSREQQELLDRAWQVMRQIDDEFRAMVSRPISEWDLSGIEEAYRLLSQDYRAMSGEDGSPTIDSRISQRLAAVQRRRTLFDEYSSFQQIMRRTEARDAAIRQTYLSRFSVSTARPTTTVVRRPLPDPPPSTPAPAPTRTQSRTVSRPRAAGAGFDGAGIVQRSAIQRPGLPSHVLLAPDGRVLTYLTAVPGIQLDRFVGHAVGIRGPRSFRSELNADLLAVHQLAPVTLRTR
jgi:hypothetical protein